jgi:hypothetical protein
MYLSSLIAVLLDDLKTRAGRTYIPSDPLRVSHSLKRGGFGKPPNLVDMKLRFAVIGLLLVVAAPLLSSAQGVPGSARTVGVAQVEVRCDAFDCEVIFDFTGLWAIGGRNFAAELVGVAVGHIPSSNIQVIIVEPFQLSGVSVDGRSVTLNCGRRWIGDLNLFKLVCSGGVTGGPVGPRTIQILGRRSDLGGCSCDFRRIHGIYRGTA